MHEILRTTWRVLSFRSTREELLALDPRHLRFGLFCTWLVGMGRYWDNPHANWLQHLGVGSVLYVFALALWLYALTRPLASSELNYRRVLTFITLVSPPAALYAIPVERFVSPTTAIILNALFLGVVALWRVSLWFFYLRRVVGTSAWATLVVGLLPLALIVTALLALNLEHATFEIMAGIDPKPSTSHDGAYLVVFLLSMLSLFSFGPLFLAYLWLVYRARRKPAAEAQGAWHSRTRRR